MDNLRYRKPIRSHVHVSTPIVCTLSASHITQQVKWFVVAYLYVYRYTQRSDWECKNSDRYIFQRSIMEVLVGRVLSSVLIAAVFQCVQVQIASSVVCTFVARSKCKCVLAGGLAHP